MAMYAMRRGDVCPHRLVRSQIDARRVRSVDAVNASQTFVQAHRPMELLAGQPPNVPVVRVRFVHARAVVRATLTAPRVSSAPRVTTSRTVVVCSLKPLRVRAGARSQRIPAHSIARPLATARSGAHETPTARVDGVLLQR